MSKILLINPPLSKHSDCHIPVNLLTLQSYFKNKGFVTDVLDLALIAHKYKYGLNKNYLTLSKQYLVNLREYSYVGLSTMCNTIGYSIELAQWIKQNHPNIKIILGGPHATACYKAILEEYNDIIDFIVVGEGEITATELLLGLEFERDVSSIKGIAYYKDEVRFTGHRALLDNLDTLPKLNFNELDFSDYYKENAILSIEAGRGCPYSCIYCSTSLMWERRHRIKSVDRIISELEDVDKHTNFLCISFTHDCFTTNKHFVIELCKAIKKKGIGIKWSASSRCDTIDEDMIHHMRGAGCTGLFFGIESGSSVIQNNIGKYMDIHKSFKTLKLSVKSFKDVTASFIIGFPHETKADIDDTLKFACNARAFGVKIISFFKLSFLPGTKICKDYCNDLYFDKYNLSNIVSAGHYTDSLEADIRKYKSIYSAYYSIANYNKLSNESIYLLQECASVIVRAFPFAMLYLSNELGHSLYDIIMYFFRSLSIDEKHLILNREQKISVYNYNVYRYFRRYILDSYTDNKLMNIMIYDSVKFILQMKNTIDVFKFRMRKNALRWIFSVLNKRLSWLLPGDNAILVEMHKETR